MLGEKKISCLVATLRALSRDRALMQKLVLCDVLPDEVAIGCNRGFSGYR